MKKKPLRWWEVVVFFGIAYLVLFADWLHDWTAGITRNRIDVALEPFTLDTQPLHLPSAGAKVIGREAGICLVVADEALPLSVSRGIPEEARSLLGGRQVLAEAVVESGKRYTLNPTSLSSGRHGFLFLSGETAVCFNAACECGKQPQGFEEIPTGTAIREIVLSSDGPTPLRRAYWQSTSRSRDP